MLKVIRKFFAFCGKENRQKFITSIWLSVLQAIFEALKIPAITAMIRALMRGNVETKDILISLGIMLIGILGAGLVKSKATMLQTEGGYDTCAKKRVEIAEHMRYLPMGYFNANSLGQITSVTTNVMENLENVATRVVMLGRRRHRHRPTDSLPAGGRCFGRACGARWPAARPGGGPETAAARRAGALAGETAGRARHPGTGRRRARGASAGRQK